ncbi:MAG: heavy-metal-associated domain-containing protein [Planctomycetota bacterium]
MSRSLAIALSVAVLSSSATLALAESSKKVEPATTAQHTPPKQDTSLDSLKNKPKTTLKIAKTDTVMYVGDLHCKHCAKSLTSKLYTVKGVKSVRADIKADIAVVTPQNKKKLDHKALWAAAKKSGFPAIKLIGPTGTYVIDAKTKEPKLVAEKAGQPAKS